MCNETYIIQGMGKKYMPSAISNQKYRMKRMILDLRAFKCDVDGGMVLHNQSWREVQNIQRGKQSVVKV